MLWVAETSGLGETQRVVAMIVIWIIIDEAHIGSIAVHPDYRRRGIGRRILLQALIEAGKKGATMATLEVRRSNLPAQAMYRQLGFSGVGVRPRYYRDNGEDALLMTLQELDPVKLQSVLETLGND
jgi:ribosomal-protein-alanine N-acetyltransferase